MASYHRVNLLDLLSLRRMEKGWFPARAFHWQFIKSEGYSYVALKKIRLEVGTHDKTTHFLQTTWIPKP